MKIMVSACLMGINCKYDGLNNQNDDVLALLKDHEIILICPEVMGGLPVPRFSSEIDYKTGKVYSQQGKDVTDNFAMGAQKSLEIALKEQPDLIILKRKSPSCGLYQVYDGTFTRNLVDGPGKTAQLLLENGFTCIEAEQLADYLKTNE